MSELLKGKVAVVTGSGQGIGRAIAIGLAAEGAKVVTNNRKPGSTGAAQMSPERLAKLSKEEMEWYKSAEAEQNGDAETTAMAIRADGGEATAFFGDISKFDVAEQLIKTAVDTYGRIDILVNVAGRFGFSNFEDISEELWDNVNTVKPKGYFATMKYAVPYMKEQGFGRIINCTSRAFMGDVLKHAEYCAANVGVVGLTRAAAIELRQFGITCNAFGPFAKTRAAYELDAMKVAAGFSLTVKEGMPLPKYEYTPTPDYLVPFLAWLCTEEAEKVSGSVFTLAGNSIQLHSDPVVCASLVKQGEEKWTVEEIGQMAPRALFSNYTSIADEYPL